LEGVPNEDLQKTDHIDATITESSPKSVSESVQILTATDS